MKCIRINVDVVAGQLELADNQSSHTVLEGYERIEWIFVGIPNNYAPSVHFRVGRDRAGSPTGPFSHLRQTSFQVFGSGRSGSAQQLYEVAVKPIEPDSDLPRLTLPLSLEATAPNGQSTAPTVLVSPDPDDSGALIVSPEDLSIVAGDTVLWKFEGFSEPNWYPVVHFTRGPMGSSTWPFGPFTSLCTGDALVVGAGNNHVPGHYRYYVHVIDSLTQRVLRHWDGDPGLGNDTDPVGGGG